MQAATVLHVPVSKPRKKAVKRTTEGWFSQLPARRKMAVITGSVGVCVLLLSVVHCTEALMAFTGSPVYLAVLLAIGIDAGMVACEMAAIVAGPHAKRWAKVYIGLSVALSIVLNGSASAAHADGAIIAWVVGGVIPVLVFVLGQVAGGLWDRE